MGEKVWIALISAGTGALVGAVFKIVDKIIDICYENNKKENNKKDKFLEKKEEVYIEALQRLLHFKEMFAFSYETILKIPELKKRMKDKDEEFRLIAPKLRLYASDKIFDEYYKLAVIFVNKKPEVAMPKDFINLYDIHINDLSRKMQNDLGYRKYDSEIITILCPRCEEKHDFYAACPKCKMSYEEMLEKQIEKMNEQIEKMNEQIEKMNEQKKSQNE